MDLTLRVQSDKFHTIISAHQDLLGSDMVQSLSISSQDVTDSFIDVTSPLRPPRGVEKRFRFCFRRSKMCKKLWKFNVSWTDWLKNMKVTSREPKASRSNPVSAFWALIWRRHRKERLVTTRLQAFDPVLIAFKPTNDVLVAFMIILEIVTYYTVAVVSSAIPACVSFWVCTSLLSRQHNLG